MCRVLRQSLSCLAIALAWPVCAFAQASPPVYDIRRTDKPPVIDGRLDDACWQNAPVLTNFTQVLPVEGASPTEQTEVRFVYNADYLFIAVRCFDTEPNKIIAKQMQRDSDLESDDMVTIAFDTFSRQREGYYFAVNPAGARTEGLIENFTEQNALWDTVWEAHARVDSQGWTAEIAIPFKSLSFDPKRDTWGCNIERVIRRKQEIVRWTALSRAKSATSLADFGELRGLTGMRQGLGLEARPFLSTKYQDDAVNGQKDWDVKPGGDLTYNITPSLKANATVNTDFAEADVDERVVNLTRFPLFFPEKRDFFLQDSSLFRFGGLYDSPTPYYSRRIGLSADGKPVDIITGGRLTGRVGDTRVALLDVQQDAQNSVESKNLFVGRVSTKAFEESEIGVFATHGDPVSNANNTLLGFDFNYLNSRLPDEKRLVSHTWLMSTSSETMGDDVAFGGDLDYPNEPLEVHVFFWQIGENFDPALGFVERRGIREYMGFMQYVWRPNTELIRSVSLSAHPNVTTDLDNRVVAEDHDAPVLTITTPAEDELTLEYTSNRDVLDEPFEIHPGVAIPRGDYRFGRFKPFFRSSEARPVSVEFTASKGDYYTGIRRDYEGEIDWRPSRYVTTGIGYVLNQIRLPEGDFDVRVTSGRLNLTFTPDLSWNTIVQYDNVSGIVGVNSRIRWTYCPGSDLFLVVNRGWDFDEWRFRTLTTELAVKLVATFRF
jgi:hypothetical protein